ncbi:MAG: hydrogenase maturation nickel metallochaperone HypA [Rhodopirellula sp.]|nr:hydrogenase maturation nickel metallochaperone HypA [Rhodopirellula sp.]
MHEASLVRSLLRQVGELLFEHEAEAVVTIRVEMGPLSGVERVLVELAFADLVESTECRGANLIVEEVPLSARCRDCAADFEIERFRFACSHCGSSRVQVTGGEEFRLLDVELKVPQESGSL